MLFQGAAGYVPVEHMETREHKVITPDEIALCSRNHSWS